MTGLRPDERSFLDAARTATLATMAADGRPRLVPICFVVASDGDATGRPVLYSPLDEKPKSVADPRALARVRDFLARPDVGVLVDRWSEDWSKLGWLRIHGRADLVEPGDAPAGIVERLRSKYPQYRDHDLASRPLIRISVEHATSWGDLRPG